MRSRATILTLAFIAIRVAFADPSFGADISWINAAGGSWSTPGNWSTNSVPGPSDRALITLPGTYAVTLDVNPSVAAIFVGAGSGQQTLFGSGRALAVTESISVTPSGVLDLINSTVSGRLADRALVVARRNCTFSGQTNVEVGATLRVLGASGGSAMLTVGPLTNRGTIELTAVDGNFQSNLTGAGPVTNASGGLIRTLPGTGGERHLSVPIINQGMVTLDYLAYFDNTGLSFLNDVGGTIDVGNTNLVLSQSGGSFSNQGTMTIGATRVFSVSAGSFSNSGTIAGAGTLALNNTTIAGSLSPASTVVLDLTNCTVNASVTNQGLTVLHGFSTFNGGLINQAGATLRNLAGSGTNTYTTLASAVTNHGTIEMTTVTGNLQSNLVGNGPLTNETGGLIRVLVGTGGERHLSVPTTNRGTVSLESVLYLDNSGSQLNDVGGLYDLSGADLVVTQSGASPSFNNQGTVSVASGRTWSISGGAFTNTGSISGAGSLSLASLTANLNTALTLNLASVSATTSTLNVPQGLTNGATTTLTLNNVTVNGAITNNGLMVTRRNVTLNGSLTNETGSTLRVLGASGGSANLIIGPVTNRGALELTTIDGNFQSNLSGSGTLTNVAGSTFRVLPGTGGERHLQAAMVNQGTMTVEYSLYLDNGTKAQLNDVGGTISLTTGDIVLSQSGAGSFTNRGTLSVGAGRTFAISGGTFLNDIAGTLRGSGTISSSGPDITNAGTISPGASPGRLSFNGKVVQASTGRVRIELSGTQPITQYDVLQCSGQVVLGGTLQVALLGGFVPPAATPFVVLKYGSRTGTFTSYEGLNLGGSLQFSPTYTDTAMILSTGPLAITSVTPNRGGQGTVSCVVHGAGFFPGLTAKLVRGASQVPGTLLGISPLGIGFGVKFDLTGKALGAWDVVVQGADGTTVTLPGGFTVEPVQPAWVSVQIVGRPVIRVGRPASYEFVFTNNGNVDAVGVPAYIGGLPSGSSFGPGFAPSPTVPGASPIDYNSFPKTYGPSNSSILPVILPRVPPGASVRMRVTVQTNAPGSIPLKTWVNPAFYTPGVTPQMLECYIALMEAVLQCGGIFVPPGGACITQLVALYFETVLSVSGTGLDIVDPDEEEASVAISMIETVVTVTVGAFETIIECVVEDLPNALKVFNAFMCGWDFGQALHECSSIFTRDGESALIVSAVTGHDPNDKAGPSGIGIARFVRNSEPLPYAIYFENLETATAPAQEVVVADTLDTTKVDVSTVALGPIRFGTHVLTPPPGSTSYLGALDLRPTTNLVVRADVRLDTAAGVLTWRLSSIDPDTGAPPEDPFAGFLPPNITPPQGEGSVQYTVQPKSGMMTGTVVGNRASIVFDTNEAILTPVWTNAFDATPPTSAVGALPAVTQTLSIPVTWGGNDAGSGVKDYTIHVSVDGGPDSVWLDRVPQTSGYFSGAPGHSYAFYSVARDSTLLTETAPGEPDAQTTISSSVGVGERRFAFALRGALPNPADSRVLVSFELPATRPGTVELYDLAGRRVAHRDLGAFRPGPHSVSLGQGERIRPGMYFVRLRHGARSAVMKVVVAR
ncbi:MAG TPA: T9SS type A sorting domain-containing protein [Candidatus Eisenbacteria bacterium]|nr:T9SS type A sorting domain-containing protein [Candidatus Eisenbacteria bacterium]